MQTKEVPAKTSLHMRPETHRRLSKFKQTCSLIPLNTLINRAITFYLDYAEQGVDGNLTPVKNPKM